MRWGPRPFRLFGMHRYHASFTAQGNIRRVTDHLIIIHPLQGASLCLSNWWIFLYIALSLIEVYHRWCRVHSWQDLWMTHSLLLLR